MKKICTFFLIALLFLTSCSFNWIGATPSKTAKSQAAIILECINNGDVEKLKSLFCENIRSKHNLDVELAEAVEFVDGKIVSEGDWYGMMAGGETVSNGKLVKQNIHPGMENITTDSGAIYRIVFCTNLVYEEDNKNVGMTYIVIYDETNGYDENNDKYMVGAVIH